MVQSFLALTKLLVFVHPLNEGMSWLQLKYCSTTFCDSELSCAGLVVNFTRVRRKHTHAQQKSYLPLCFHWQVFASQEVAAADAEASCQAGQIAFAQRPSTLISHPSPFFYPPLHFPITSSSKAGGTKSDDVSC